MAVRTEPGRAIKDGLFYLISLKCYICRFLRGPLIYYYLTRVMRSEHGTFLDRSLFSVSGQEGVDYRYRGVNKGTGRVVIKFARAQVVSNTVYLLDYTPADRDSTEATETDEHGSFVSSQCFRNPVGNDKMNSNRFIELSFG